MTDKEMNRRLLEMTPAELDRVKSLIAQGFGSTGIRFETGLPVRLINAAFQLVQGR